MANQPPTGPQAGAITDDALTVYASIDADALTSRLSNEARRLLTDGAQQGMTPAELANYLESGLADLSTVPYEKAGRMAGSEAFNLGRNLGFLDEGTGYVVRTEILDDATCDPCAELDGQVYQVGSLEYFENMPPNRCEGRELCRGFYMPKAA